MKQTDLFEIFDLTQQGVVKRGNRLIVSSMEMEFQYFGSYRPSIFGPDKRAV